MVITMKMMMEMVIIVMMMIMMIPFPVMGQPMGAGFLISRLLRISFKFIDDDL
jgi:hypothetical protein